MADFSTPTSQTIESHTTVKQGVQTPSVFGAVKDIFDAGAGLVTDVFESKGQQAVSDFTQQNLAIVDAVDQGNLKSPAGRTRMRNNLSQAIAANPHLEAELWASFKNVTGSSPTIQTGGRAEQESNRMRGQLIQAGMIGLDATNEEMIEANTYFVQEVAAAEKFRIQQQTLDAQEAAGRLTAAEASAAGAAAQAEFFRAGQPAQIFKTRNEIAILLGGQGTEAEKVQAIDGLEQEFLNLSAGMAAGMNKQQSTYLYAPFNMMFDNAREQATGVLSDAEVVRRNERTLSAVESQALMDPDMAKIAVGQKLFGAFIEGNVSAQMWGKVGTWMAQNDPSTSGNGNPFTTGVQSPEVIKGVLDTLSTGMDSKDPEVVASATAQFTHLLEGVTMHAPSIEKDPLAAQTLVEYMATPKFLKMAKQTDTGDMLPQAAQVIGMHYSSEVFGMADREFTRASVAYVPAGTEIPEGAPTDNLTDFIVGTTGDFPLAVGSTKSLIRAEAVPNGVRFVAIDPKNIGTVDEARRLNRELAPVINQTVKAAAHLKGVTDYQKEFESLMGEYLGAGADKVEGGLGKDLELSNFVGDGTADVEVNDLTATTTLPSSGTMTKVEGMIIHHTGGRGTVDGVVNTLAERGLSVQYVIDRDGKVHKLMADDAVAFHAGKNNDSGFDNNNTVGVEIIANDDADVTSAQVAAAQKLSNKLGQQYGFNPAERVFGHGEVATHKRPAEGSSTTSALRG